MESTYDPVPTEGDEVPTKKVRHRKKQFLKTIRKQMEFYFSDANLSKNRYLGQLVSKDPQVDLTTFLSFNKIRDITTELDDIKKALKKSEMLALTEDGNKVYRKTRVRQNENADESTIYVEQLPPDADHEWIKGVFLPYGDVPYVSIPKYPHNGLNKGFAFVEFDTPASAAAALEAFGATGRRLAAEMPPEQVCSIKQTIARDSDFKVPADTDALKPTYKRKISFDDDNLEPEGKSARPKKRRRPAGEAESGEEDGGGREAETQTKVEAEVEGGRISPECESGPAKKKRRPKKSLGEQPGDSGPEEGGAKGTKRGKKEVKEEEEAIENEPEEGDTKGSKRRKNEIKEEAKDAVENEPEEGSAKGTKRRKKEVKEEEDVAVENEPEEGSAKETKRCKKEIKEEVEETVENEPEEGDAKETKRRKKEVKEKKEAIENEPEEGDTKETKRRNKEIKEEPDEAETSDNKDSKDDEKENEGNDEVRKKKRSRNHKKKGKKEKPETEPKMNLRVLSKLEWKRLRNKYLGLQKVKMTQLKQHLRRGRWAGNSQDYQQQQHRRQGGEDDGGTDGSKPAAKSEKKFAFTPGVIIHLRFPEPPADVKLFKTEAKANAEVKYVDAREGWNEAYVRCSTAEAANQMLAQQTWSQMDILTGVEETAYWEKMSRDREVQCGRNERVKVRGKAKLLAKVERAAGKHIRFAAAEEEGESGPRG